MLSEWLEVMRVWIEGLILSLGYVGIALIMLVENLFPPIPSELVMPFAGFLAARGELNFVGVLAAGVLGSVAGAVILYGFGAWAGERLVRPLVVAYGRWLLLSEEDFDRAMAIFGRFGQVAVLAGRLMPLVRSLISVPAGMNRMPLGPFVLLTTTGTLLWNLLLAGAGWWLGARWDDILLFTKQYERGVLVTLAVVAAGWVILQLARRRAARRTDEA